MLVLEKRCLEEMGVANAHGVIKTDVIKTGFLPGVEFPFQGLRKEA